MKSSVLLGSYLNFHGKTPAGGSQSGYVSNRPAAHARRFTSKAVEEKILKVKSMVKDKEIAWMFENCFPNTLDTTVDYEQVDGRPDAFVITGDIDAMWLRDSTAQVWPYLPLVTEDDALKNLIRGLIHRQTLCVLLDPYANAFYKDRTKISEWSSDKPAMKPGIHERKWEVDSLCYVIRLANEYYKITKDASIFDADWDKAMRQTVQTFKTEQRKDGSSPYWFNRRTDVMIDAPPYNGTGQPIRPVGLICSMFRPSDDATLFPFLIPSNLFASQSLRQLARIYAGELKDASFANECDTLADAVESAVKKHAVSEYLEFGEIYAYEVDGFGNRIFLDDANVPSLISLAYLGIHEPTDALYRNTRRFVLSGSNPFYLSGKAAEGQGSPHTGKANIWPMGLILRAITSIDEKEIAECLGTLKRTHAGTGFMHESFHKDDASNFTRKWFAWANTLFGELVLKVLAEHPHVLKKQTTFNGMRQKA
jgi:meiotically up-regulated gene 157 (Mug157) protein